MAGRSKEVTISELAEKVARMTITELAERLAKIETKADEHVKLDERIEKALTQMIETLGKNMAAMDQRVSRLERALTWATGVGAAISVAYGIWVQFFFKGH